MNCKKKVVKNKKILNGEPVIKGTRIPVASIVGQFSKNGCNFKDIKKIYPQLSKKQVQAALEYSAKNLKK